ncbi:MAG: DUF2905 domain-containing protein [Nitrospirae bacterium]|nr:DUF2905 domain-containing protein [Nitrospirota bacterium]MBI3352659.1 DUF2905 domain-containing protein [Nitrospirota bacterium]
MARSLIVLGFVLAGVGVIFLFAEKFPDKIGWLGKLPGDIYVEKKDFKFYFPLTTSILISLILTLVFWFFGKR